VQVTAQRTATLVLLPNRPNKAHRVRTVCARYGYTWNPTLQACPESTEIVHAQCIQRIDSSPNAIMIELEILVYSFLTGYSAMHFVPSDSQGLGIPPSTSNLRDDEDPGAAARHGALKRVRSMSAGIERIEIVIHSKKTMPKNIESTKTRVGSQKEHTRPSRTENAEESAIQHSS
jgi:hypothetical protein